MTESRMILAYRAPDAVAAAMLVEALRVAGVPAVTTGGTSDVGFGELPADSLMIDIYVPQSMTTEARAAIVQAQERVENPVVSWHCEGCGEGNDEILELCWNCQQARPKP
jgi:hypothetical protein